MAIRVEFNYQLSWQPASLQDCTERPRACSPGDQGLRSTWQWASPWMCPGEPWRVGPRKGPDFGSAAPSQSLPLPGSVFWVWPKLGFGQAGSPPGGFGTDSWDVVFPALRRWRLEMGPRWGWSLECRAPRLRSSAGQWGHGWVEAGGNASERFPREGLCQRIRARWSRSFSGCP